MVVGAIGPPPKPTCANGLLINCEAALKRIQTLYQHILK